MSVEGGVRASVGGIDSPYGFKRFRQWSFTGADGPCGYWDGSKFVVNHLLVYSGAGATVQVARIIYVGSKGLDSGSYGSEYDGPLVNRRSMSVVIVLD